MVFFAWNDMKFHWNHVASRGFSDLGDASKAPHLQNVGTNTPLIATASLWLTKTASNRFFWDRNHVWKQSKSRNPERLCKKMVESSSQWYSKSFVYNELKMILLSRILRDIQGYSKIRILKIWYSKIFNLFGPSQEPTKTSSRCAKISGSATRIADRLMSAVACRVRGGDPMGGRRWRCEPPKTPELHCCVMFCLSWFIDCCWILRGWKDKWQMEMLFIDEQLIAWMNLMSWTFECFKEVHCCDLAKLVCVFSLWFNWCLFFPGRDFQLEVHHDGIIRVAAMVEIHSSPSPMASWVKSEQVVAEPEMASQAQGG